MWSPARTRMMSAPDWWMASRLAATASAVPRYHSRARPRATKGCRMRMPPTLRSRSQGRPAPMWSFSESGAYCVRTRTLVRPELTQLESVKSMMRYLPPNGTAGLARTPDRSERRSPSPPARTTASVRLTHPMLHLRTLAPRPNAPGGTVELAGLAEGPARRKPFGPAQASLPTRYHRAHVREATVGGCTC